MRIRIPGTNLDVSQVMAPAERGCVQRTSRSGSEFKLGKVKFSRPAAGAPHTAALLWLLGAPAAHAHPGHDLFSQGPAHAFTSPTHLCVGLLIGLVMFALSRMLRRAWLRRIAQSCAVVLITIAVALLNLRG